MGCLDSLTSLTGPLAPHFFSSLFCKIFIRLMLRLIDRRRSRQNLEPEGLTRKIFWNKELAVDFWPLFCVDCSKMFAFL